MLQFTVDEGRCTRCGRCVKDCPSEIIEQSGKAVPRIAAAREEDCLQCQHCLAVCPAAALSILGRNPDWSLPISARRLPSLPKMALLVRGRRSVRQYRDRNVEPALLGELLATLANAPTGVNHRGLTFHVIDDKAVMQRFRETAYRRMAKAPPADPAAGWLDLPQTAADYLERGADLTFRGAPHALVISAAPDAPCGQEDVTLALAYFELLACCAGLGTVWCGLMKMVLEALPELKPLIGLAADHRYYAMLFGYPAVRYARTVQRDDAATVHRVTLTH